MIKTILAIACLLIATTAVHLVHEQEDINGLVVNIKGSNGKYLSSSNGFDDEIGAYPVSASVNESDGTQPWAQWVIEQHGEQIAFRNVASNTYLARCNNCWNSVTKSTWNDSAFVHVQDIEEGAHALWTVTQLSNGKFTIQGDNEEYLNVCNQCVVGGHWQDYAFVEVDNPEEEQLNGIAQWEITDVEQ